MAHGYRLLSRAVTVVLLAVLLSSGRLSPSVLAAPDPGLSIGGVTVAEGNSGTTNATFTVTLSAASVQAVTVRYATANGTATAPADYTAVSPTTLTLAPGETSKAITVPVNGDTTPEPNETFTVTLSNPTNATIQNRTGRATIQNDDGPATTRPPTLSIGSVSVSEGDSGTKTATFVVSLSAPAGAGGVAFDIATQEGTATTANSDYLAKSLTAQTIAQGSQSYSFSVVVNGDTSVEPDEAFFVNVSNVTGATVQGGNGKGTGTITNDDGAGGGGDPTVSIADAATSEGNSGTKNLSFAVTLSAASTGQVRVDYATANDTATAPSDYQSASGTLTFNPGETSKSVAVAIVGDTTAEPDERFFVNLSNPRSATTGDGQAIGTIQNDDGSPPPPGQPALSINNVAHAEGDGGTTDFTFTVSLSAPAGAGGVTFGIATQDGTATAANADYVAKSLTGQTIPEGIQAYSFTVQGNGDTTTESDEAFLVNVTNVTGATVADGQGIGTIQNDDSGGGEGGGILPTISIGDVTLAEGNSGTTPFVFTATLSAASNKPISVAYATANGTANPATAGSDYQATSGTLNFKGGDTSAQLTVLVNGDITSEANETFFVTLSNPTNATISDGQGVGTIENDDNQPPTASAQAVTTAEDTALLITLAGTDSDNDPLTFKIATLPTSGKLYKGDGTTDEITSVPTALPGTLVTYLPNSNYSNTGVGADVDSFQFKVNDGTADSAAAATVSITVSGLNDAPVLANVEATALTYTEGDPPTAVTATITVSDGDSANLAGATVKIDPGCMPTEDVLALTPSPQHGITGAYTAATCTLLLTGSASPADYQSALRSVFYSNSNTTNPSTAPRTLRFQADDSANRSSDPLARDLTVFGVNDAPVLANLGTTALTYTEGDPPTAVAAAITVTDADSANLTRATVKIDGGCVPTEDVLALDPSPQNGITGTYTADTCSLVLFGSATPASYQTALRAVKYSNTNAFVPISGARTLSFQARDDSPSNNLSNIPTRNINVGFTPPRPPVAFGDAFTMTAGATLSGNLTADNGFSADQLGVPAAAVTVFGDGSLGGTLAPNPDGTRTGHAAGASVALAGGTLTVNADGTFSLVGATTGGTHRFRYRLTNAVGSDDATVTIEVRTRPDAFGDDFTMTVGETLSGNLTADNGILPDVLGVPAAAVTVFGGGSLGEPLIPNPDGTWPGHAAGASVALAGGTLTVNADGTFSLAGPTTGGFYVFGYVLANAVGSDVGEVDIEVRSGPRAELDFFTMTVGATLSGNLTVYNGTDPDELGVPAAAVTSFGGFSLEGSVADHAAGASVALAGGTLTVNADGTFSLVGATTGGTHRFRYRLTNAVGSDDATVTIEVN